jgi:hypothetical protein
MFPYQIYQAMTDQRIRDLVAEARRHELVAEARNAHRDHAEASSRLKDTAARIRVLLHVTDHSRERSTMATTSGAGPMGCVA